MVDLVVRNAGQVLTCALEGIRAPLAGTILQRSVEEGTVIQSASQNVSGGSVLFIMAELAAMQVRTLVDETDMGQLKAGMSAEVSVEDFAKIFKLMKPGFDPDDPLGEFMD